jgi:hypothetical protein
MRVIAASSLGPHGAGPAWADGAVHDEPPAGQGAQGLKLVRGVHVQTISDDVSTPEKQLLIRAFFKIKLLTHFDPHERDKIGMGSGRVQRRTGFTSGGWQNAGFGASLDRGSSGNMVGATGIEPVTPAMSTPRKQRKNKSLG